MSICWGSGAFMIKSFTTIFHLSQFRRRWKIWEAIIGIPFPLSEDQIQALKNLLPKELPKETETMLLNRMLCKEYLLITQKKSGIGP